MHNYLNSRFFLDITLYYYHDRKGECSVNEFEQDVQCKRNDAIDAGVGFVVSFGFFATLFIIATVVQFIGS